MCGLFGFSGKKQVNVEKFKILALYNDSRGGDSTGIFYNGGETEKDLGNAFKFFKTHGFNKDVEHDDRVMFGHTRKSSSGAKTKENAHPFTYVLNKSEFKSSFAHNGTLYTWKQDMGKFIDPALIANITVDSQALGLLITQKKYDYLKTFDGAVTYLFYHKDEPNTLQVFKGATLNYKRELVADRPMFALKTKEGLYFSSLIEALECISEEGDEFVDVPENEILFYKDGELVKSIKIDRKVELTYTTQSNWDWNKNNFNNTSSTTKYPLQKKEIVSEKKENVRRFWNDTIKYSSNVFRGRVYFNRGRYYRNGHLMNSFFSDDNGNITMNAFNISQDGRLLYENEKNIKSTKYYFYNGLILNIKSTDEDLDIIRTYKGFRMLFKHVKNISEKDMFKIPTYSKAISKKVLGYFAFLDSELNTNAPRFYVYKDGEVAKFSEERFRLSYVKFARKVMLAFTNDFHDFEVNDYLKHDQDYEKLSVIVQKPNKHNVDVIQQSHKDFFESNKLNVRTTSDLFLDSLYERLINIKMLNEMIEEENYTNGELRLMADIDVLTNDVDHLYTRITNSEYEEVRQELNDEIEELLRKFKNDLETILELV